MSGIDPISTIAQAITELAKVIQTWISGGDQKLRLEVRELKKQIKANEIAEEAFEVVDKIIASKTINEATKLINEYRKLKIKFNKYD